MTIFNLLIVISCLISLFHMNSIHEGVRYNCEKCDKSFTDSSSMKAHVRNVHEGRRKNKCELCNKAFSCLSNLKYHINSAHEGFKKGHKCEICQKSYCTSYYLDAHIKSVHKVLPSMGILLGEQIL